MVLLVPDWGMGESAAETAAVSNYHARISEQSTKGDPSGWKDPEFQPEPLEDELALLPLKSQVRYFTFLVLFTVIVITLVFAIN
jgi:hypothetical protein